MRTTGLLLGCLAVSLLGSSCATGPIGAAVAASGVNPAPTSAPSSAALPIPSSLGIPTSAGLAQASLLPTVTALTCGSMGVSGGPLPAGSRLVHTGVDAAQVAAAAHVGPTENVRIYALWVRDPTADKVGLGDSSQFRAMWVIDGTEIAPSADPGRAAPPPEPAGLIYRTISLIDDQTLKLGGNFSCGVVSTPPTPGVPDVAPPFRTACGHPGSQVVLTTLPMTIAHTSCDLTGVIVLYGNSGLTIPQRDNVTVVADGSPISTTLTADVDPTTKDVTLTGEIDSVSPTAS